MTFIVTTDYDFLRVTPPNLPLAPTDYDSRYQEQFNNVLRLYFNQLNKIVGQLTATMSTLPVEITGTNLDAFGRVRVSNPFTLFDSSHRYADNNLWATSTTGTAAATFSADEGLVNLTVGTATATHLLEGALSELERRHAHRFIRIHRNALVARAALRALEKTEAGPDGSGWAVRLHGIDEPLPVSRRQLNAVREAILA